VRRAPGRPNFLTSIFPLNVFRITPVEYLKQGSISLAVVPFNHLFGNEPSHQFSSLIVKSLALGDLYVSAWLRRKL